MPSLAYNTPARIITFAMKDAGLLQEGETPNSDNYAEYMDRLNDLVNTWQTQGLKLWVNSMLSVPLVAGTATYTLGPGGAIIATKPLRVLEAYYVDVNSVDRPLDILSWNGYNTLANKTQQGTIQSIFPNKQKDNIILTTWLIPDATAAAGTLSLLIQQQVNSMLVLNDDISFPVEWYMALRWGLADDIASGQSEAIMSRCEKKASQYRMALEDWDVEDASTSFSPDYRGSVEDPFS